MIVITALRTLFSDRSGVAATEFALLLPVMAMIFFGVVEGSDALTKSRRVTLAVNTLADLAAQESELLESSADDLFEGVERIVNVNGATMTIRLVSVIAADKDGDGNFTDPVVHWSYDNSGGEPYAPDADYTGLTNAALLDANASMLVAEITYPYRSNFTHYFIDTVNFDRIATRWPRRSGRVQLCRSLGDCTN